MRPPAALWLLGLGMGLIDGALALWVGPNAKTWDEQAYLAAAQMKADGANSEAIRQQTGIWWGPDGRPRMEIDDSQSKVSEGSGILGKVLDHEVLYQAYPDMREMPAEVQGAGFFDESLSGHYQPPAHGIGEMITVKASEDQRRLGIIHEAQHAIQQREGFAQGGVPGKASVFDVQTNRDLWEMYRRIMGEAEARAAAERVGLDAKQRRIRPPEQSYDVPINELTR